MRRTKRAIRRHHYRRLVHKYAATCSHWYGFSKEDQLNRGRKMATTAQGCSCSGCGNVRSHWGSETKQEVNARHLEQEGREEVGLRTYKIRKGKFIW